jgi:hypothetical protein
MAAWKRVTNVCLRALAFLSVATSSTVLRAPALQDAHGSLTRTCANLLLRSAQGFKARMCVDPLPAVHGRTKDALAAGLTVAQANAI